MGLFSKLFAKPFAKSGAKPKQASVEPTEFNGFLIYPEAQEESGQYRVCGRITKEVEGKTETHHFIRSDMTISEGDANEIMLRKAKLFIEQSRGDIF